MIRDIPRARPVFGSLRAAATSPRLLAFATAFAGVCSCQVFDERLLQDTDGHESEGEDSHSHGSAGEEIELADDCTADVPVLQSADVNNSVNLADLTDNYRSFPTCGYSGTLAGPEGFFTITAAAGERWHVALSPRDPNLDIAVVIQSRCDPQSCERIMDRCGPGLPEEITLTAPSPRDFLIALDSKQTSADAQVEVYTLAYQCGDGVAEHGEGCEDGNNVDGDGCDAHCRVELHQPLAPEAEPNNWHTEGNVIAAMPEARITGSIGGPCDTDHYILHLADRATITAELLPPNELPCEDSAPSIQMRFVKPSLGSIPIGTGKSGRSAGTCPSIEVGDQFNEELEGGEYHLVVEADPGSVVFNYLLRIGVTES